MEVWKPIPGFEGLYMISDLGRVKSIPRNGTKKEERILVPNDSGFGYLKITLSKNNTPLPRFIHHLVAKTFLPVTGPVIDHIDGNKHNNSLSNLRFCTKRQNQTFSNVKRPNQTCSSIGVYKINESKFRARIHINGRKKHLGYFKTEAEAASAYKKEVENGF